MVLADYGFLNVIWSMILFGLFFMWIWIVIMCFMDIFRREDFSGMHKALWLIFIILVPFLAVFIYLIARPKMTEQDRYEESQKRAAGYSSADEVAKLSELHRQGSLTDEEYAALKAKAIA